MSFLSSFASTCPSCCEASMYEGMLSIRDECPKCGLRLKEHDAGDGPAYIAICIVGALVVLAAVFTEFAFTPPMWLHLLLWIPITLFGTIGVLRLAKNWLIHAQYIYQKNMK